MTDYRGLSEQEFYLFAIEEQVSFNLIIQELSDIGTYLNDVHVTMTNEDNNIGNELATKLQIGKYL